MHLTLNEHDDDDDVTNKQTVCSRVLLDKLLVQKLVTNFLVFYGTRSVITTLTTAHHSCVS